MEQSFKYLTQNEDDLNWGIYANVAGYANVEPDEEYPPQGHPDNYQFTWEKGRILDEFQLLYITKGNGIFETKNKKYDIKEGDTILIYPFMWHRYRPLKGTGWTESYVGFGGDIANQVIKFFPQDNPVRYIGFNDIIYQSYKVIFQLANLESMGYQQAIGGKILFLLGKIRHITLNKSYADNASEKIINQARLYMRSHFTESFHMEDLSKSLNISYSSFRTEFKKYTGISPGQYLLQLKIQMAKNLLSNSFHSIKEISFESGFDSPFYFSRAFKKHIGLTPSEFRDQSETVSKEES